MNQNLTQAKLEYADGKNPFEEDCVNLLEVDMNNEDYIYEHLNLTEDEIISLFDEYIKTDKDLDWMGYLFDVHLHEGFGEPTHEEAKELMRTDKKFLECVECIFLSSMMGVSDGIDDMYIYGKAYNEVVPLLPEN